MWSRLEAWGKLKIGQRTTIIASDFHWARVVEPHSYLEVRNEVYLISRFTNNRRIPALIRYGQRGDLME
jgi:hypothetical protein